MSFLSFIKDVLQIVLDKITYRIHKDTIVIGNNPFAWCRIPVPEGYPKQSQTHPSILYIPGGWKGATHWLGTTPYPGGDIRFENPCIYYANSRKGCAPTSFTPIKNNPVADWPGGKSFNSDVDLFLGNETLYVINRVNEGHILREVEIYSSNDGENWSAPEFVFGSNEEKRQLLSPSIIEHEGKYRIYFLSGDAGIRKRGHCGGIEVIEGTSLGAPDFKVLGKGEFLNKKETGIEPWHFDLFPYRGKLYMVFCGRNIKKRTLRYPMETYLAVSDDFMNFTIFDVPVIRYVKTYRPTAYVDENGIFNLYFSVVGSVANDGSDRAVALTSMPMERLLELVNKN